MKKLLLSLSLLLGMSTMASAADVTLPAEGKTWNGYEWTQNGTDFTATVEGYTLDLKKGSSTSNLVSPDQYSIRVYAGASLTVTATAENAFKQVVVVADAKYSKAIAANATGWTATPENNESGILTKVTFTATTPQTSITFDGAGKQMRVQSITLSTEAGTVTPPTPPTPGTDISNTLETAYDVTKATELVKAGQGLNTKVYVKGTITGTVDISTQYGNATYDITDGTNTMKVFRGYYFNGDKFTATDQLKTGDAVVVYGNLTDYNGAAQVNTGSTLMLLNGKGAPAAETIEVGDIASFLAAAKGTVVKFTCPLTAVYQNGNSLYVTDAKGDFALFYGKQTQTYENGMVIPAGASGKRDEFHGAAQLAVDAATFGAGTPGTPVEPVIMQVEEVASDLACHYVKFVGVDIAAAGADRTFTLTDASGSVTLYQTWTNVEIPTGTGFTVEGFIGLNNGNVQILCAAVKSASGREIVATPEFTPGAGQVTAGTKVTIASATEGATIYYTLDGTNPTAASTKYAEAITVNDAVTIKAIAVKEGMDDSEIATAAYTIRTVGPVTGTDATFNFADPSTLDPAYSKDDAVADGKDGNLKIDLKNGELFFANGITISTNASGNATRLYWQAKTEAWSFRIYNKSVTTIACGEGYKLLSIEFTPQTDAYATVLKDKCTFSAGTLADNVLSIPENGNVTSVDINATATCGFTAIKVVFAKSSGINDVEIDANAPVEYYNLQGVRVEGELVPGLYIRRQGNTASKVLVK